MPSATVCRSRARPSGAALPSPSCGCRAARLIQIRRILARVSRAGTPTLLAGDLNETSDAPAWRLVTGGMRLVSSLAATFPARSPRRMIDGVFASPEFEAVAHTSLALASADLLAATDHLPIWADLTIRD